MNAYFTVLEDLLIKLDLKECPDHILNLDESGFVTDPRIFVKRGKKDPATVNPGSGKEMYTVLSCVSASGHAYPPFMLFKGKNLYEHWCHGGPLVLSMAQQTQGG